ncbi:hypothetical protein ES703_57694 [subsurface metagenome]
MGPLFNPKVNIVLEIKRTEGKTSGTGLVQEIPCTFLIPKENAYDYFDLAPFHEVLETAMGYKLSRVVVSGVLPNQTRGPYLMRVWDYYEDEKERDLAMKGKPLEFVAHLGSIRLSQHKKEDGLLRIDTSLVVSVDGAEEAGEIVLCAGRTLFADLELIQTDTSEQEEETE